MPERRGNRGCEVARSCVLRLRGLGVPSATLCRRTVGSRAAVGRPRVPHRLRAAAGAGKTRAKRGTGASAVAVRLGRPSTGVVGPCKRNFFLRNVF